MTEDIWKKIQIVGQFVSILVGEPLRSALPQCEGVHAAYDSAVEAWKGNLKGALHSLWNLY